MDRIDRLFPDKTNRQQNQTAFNIGGTVDTTINMDSYIINYNIKKEKIEQDDKEVKQNEKKEEQPDDTPKETIMDAENNNGYK